MNQDILLHSCIIPVPFLFSSISGCGWRNSHHGQINRPHSSLYARQHIQTRSKLKRIHYSYAADFEFRELLISSNCFNAPYIGRVVKLVLFSLQITTPLSTQWRAIFSGVQRFCENSSLGIIPSVGDERKRGSTASYLHFFNSLNWPRTKYLVLRRTALGELKGNTTTCQFSVDLAICVKTVINTTALLLVENNLQQLAAVFLCSDTLANNLNWVYDI